MAVGSKDNDRVEAMSFVFQLALLVAAYLEYRVRKSLEAEAAPLVLPGKRKSTNPTAEPSWRCSTPSWWSNKAWTGR